MKYKDKDGKILYGYSQRNLDEIIFLVKLLLSVIFFIMSVIIIFLIIKYPIIARGFNHLVGS